MTANQVLAEVSRHIHPRDGMWKPDGSWYFRVGRSGLRAVELALAQSWLEKPRSILDLACGHGRVARYLRAAYPDTEMLFCDLNREAADFCAEHFNGRSIHSAPELTDVALPMVDVIWVGSLFTHVDADRTRRWLRYLSGRLNPDGVLVATFHGTWSIEMQKTYPMIDAIGWKALLGQFVRDGYGFAPYPHRPEADYGISMSRPSFICDLVATIPGVRLAGYAERGWAENHDVATISRNDRLRPWTPQFRDWKAAG